MRVSKRLLLVHLILAILKAAASGSDELCLNNSNRPNKPLWSMTFGNTASGICTEPYNFSIGSGYRPVGPCSEIGGGGGQYCFSTSVPQANGKAHVGSFDYTTSNGSGCMYVVNINDEENSKIFCTTVHNLSVDTRYEFSAFFANIVKKSSNDLAPNIRLEVRNGTESGEVLAQSNTSDIPEYEKLTWCRHGLSFKTATKSVALIMISNKKSTNGNNLAIDDIELQACPSQSSTESSPSSFPTVPSTRDAITTESSTTIQEATTTAAMTSTADSDDSTSLTTTVETTSTTTTFPQSSESVCDKPHYIGTYCNVSNSICNLLQPCQNNGTCHNTTITNYTCACSPNFSGSRCMSDHRPCKTQRCLSNGSCEDGWQGPHCQYMIHQCDADKCQNKGVCRPIPNGFKCECVGYSYGTYCQFVPRRIVILKIVSKSFAYVAIIAMGSVALFVIVMDILKYGFGIDPVQGERELLRREKQAKKRQRPVIQRFTYVDAPPTPALATSTV